MSLAVMDKVEEVVEPEVEMFRPDFSNANVILLSKPRCVQCNATKRSLDAKGIAYTELDISTEENRAAYNHVKAMGYAQAPVVLVPDDHWSGFRPDKIAMLK